MYSKNGLCFNKTYADFILSARELFSFTYGANGPTFSKNNALGSSDKKFVIFNCDADKIYIGKKPNDDDIGTYISLSEQNGLDYYYKYKLSQD